MKKLILALVCLLALAAVSGCKCKSGSREYTPGKGWTPTR